MVKKNLLCGTVLAETLTVAQQVMKFAALYGTRSFVTLFRSHHSVSYIQSTPSHPTSLTSILILSYVRGGQTFGLSDLL
jgi:hypothetical protein